MKNNVTKILGILSIATWVLGAIVSIINLFIGSFILFLTNIIQFGLIGFSFIVFAKVISLLQDNNDSNKRIEYLLCKCSSKDDEYTFIEGEYTVGIDIKEGYYKVISKEEVIINGKQISVFDLHTGIDIMLQKDDKIKLTELCTFKRVTKKEQ